MPERAILEVEGIQKTFGGLTALEELDLQVDRGEILGLIGPNGAGKTTLFNIIAGALRPTRGRILFNGDDVTRLRPDQRCSRGIARTFQVVKPFMGLTIKENVLVGAHFGHKSRGTVELDTVHDLLVRLDLEHLADQSASSLSIGGLKKLELARALSTTPEIVLMDEVMGGLNSVETSEVMKTIEEIREEGTTVVLIEHVMQAVMGVSDRIVVLHNGRIIAEGTPEEVSQDPKVIEAYLGGALDAP